MREYRPEPVGRARLTPSQKREQYIKKLEYWVIVLGIADVLFYGSDGDYSGTEGVHGMSIIKGPYLFYGSKK